MSPDELAAWRAARGVEPPGILISGVPRPPARWFQDSDTRSTRPPPVRPLDNAAAAERTEGASR